MTKEREKYKPLRFLMEWAVFNSYELLSVLLVQYLRLENFVLIYLRSFPVFLSSVLTILLVRDHE